MKLLALALLLIGCTANLTVPAATRMACSTRADCPVGRICQASIGECIDPATVDSTPPQLLTAVAADATHITLGFSEALAKAPAQDSSHFSVSPTLVVYEALLASDLRTVTLSVDPQRPGASYVVSVSAVTDAFANTIGDGAEAAFTGYGANPDDSPPDIVAPPNGAVVGMHTVLIWSSRVLAATYTVDISSSDDFTQPIDGSPFTFTDPTVSFALDLPAPVTFYWRVRADVTKAGAYSKSTFNGLQQTLYVYCANGTSCASGGGAGNSTAPFQSIGTAIEAAGLLGVTDVRVARRGGTNA